MAALCLLKGIKVMNQNNESRNDKYTFMFLIFIDLLLLPIWYFMSVMSGASGGDSKTLSTFIFLPLWLYPVFILIGISLIKTKPDKSMLFLILSPIICGFWPFFAISIIESIK